VTTVVTMVTMVTIPRELNRPVCRTQGRHRDVSIVDNSSTALMWLRARESGRIFTEDNAADFESNRRLAAADHEPAGMRAGQATVSVDGLDAYHHNP